MIEFRVTVLCWFVALLVGSPALAQQKSVKPNINNAFEDPDVDKFVERFEREGREIYDQRKAIVAACRLKSGMDIADVGAGTGLLTRLFAREVGPRGRVYAVDIAKGFVDHIQKTCQQQGLNNVVGVVCDPDDARLPPGSIDLAFICDTYHHFEFPQKTMRTLHRALRPGGQLILIEFRRIEGVSSQWIMDHVRAGQETFCKEIADVGFAQVDQQDLLEENYFVRFKKVAAAKP